MVTEDEILDVLNKTTDPELGIGMVDLGLVARVNIDEGFIRLQIRTTTPRCPFQPFIMMDAHRKLLQLNGIRGAEVEITHDSPWHPKMMSDSAKNRLGYDVSRLEFTGNSPPEIEVGSRTK